MADFAYFFQEMSEIVKNFSSNLYIIKILGRYIKLMCGNYRFMSEILKTITYLNVCLILCKYWDFKDFIIND